jgi:hypothetical protein
MSAAHDRWEDKMLVRCLVSALLVFGAACASGAPGTEAPDPGDSAPGVLQASVPTRSNPNVLTSEDIRSVDVGNLYDVVRRLRPQWLRARGSASISSSRSTEPVVYVAGIRQGEVRTLQNVNIARVSRVEFIDSRDATTRFGTGHMGGAIVVDLDRAN